MLNLLNWFMPAHLGVAGAAGWALGLPKVNFGGGGGGATPPPPPAPVPPPPMLQSPQGLAAADSVRKRAAAGRGYGGTIITGPGGLTTPPETRNTQLLGGD